MEPPMTMHIYRTHNCSELRSHNVGEDVRLSGWVHRKRDHGDLVFIDLRDNFGITQIVTEVDGPAFATLERLRAESVITVTGKVVARSGDLINTKLNTGEIEVHAVSVDVQSAAEELPIIRKISA
jgi:aspartyl-tRNA synthetase